MAFEININEVVRKHQLLAKDNRTDEEEEELKKITAMLDGLIKELVDLEFKGFKLVKGKSVEAKEAMTKSEKKKMHPKERRARALEIIKECKGMEQKMIINKIREELGVAYTYGYNLLKEMEK